MISFIIVRFIMKFFIFNFANLSLDMQALIFVLCILFDLNIFFKSICGGERR